MIGHGNLADASVLSGGGWLSNLPLANLKNRYNGAPARSVSLDEAATQFTIAQPKPRSWQLLALVGHNLSLEARYRVTVAADPAFNGILYESGWKDVWPTVYPLGVLPFGAGNWWDGRYSEDERQGYNWTLTEILPYPTTAQYVRVEISDPLNENGFVDVGQRLFFAPVWQPSINVKYGASFAWEDPDTTFQRAKGGKKFFDPGTRVRVVRMETNDLPEDEILGGPGEIMRQMGLSGEVFFVWDPDDTVHALRRRFLGTLRTLSPITHPMLDRGFTPLEIEELV